MVDSRGGGQKGQLLPPPPFQPELRQAILMCLSCDQQNDKMIIEQQLRCPKAKACMVKILYAKPTKQGNQSLAIYIHIYIYTKEWLLHAVMDLTSKLMNLYFYIQGCYFFHYALVCYLCTYFYHTWCLDYRVHCFGSLSRLLLSCLCCPVKSDTLSDTAQRKS